jgi:hypothetical protein
MLLMTDAAFEAAFEGAFDAGGGGEGDESSTLLRLLVCLECELCLEAWVCDDLALDLLE